MTLIQTIDFKIHSDKRGSLVSMDIDTTVPFKVKRVYYIYNNLAALSRGFHAHKKLDQVMIAISGRCKVILDNAIKREEIWLESPYRGLLIKNMTWREMHNFSSDCILLLLASDIYDETDYIRDYKKFVMQVKRRSFRKI